MHTTYKEMPAKLRNLEPFQGSSVTATASKDWYYVYSYGTLIFKFGKRKNEARLNVTKYSVTTSKLQRMLERVFAIKDCEKVHDVPMWRRNWD